MPSWSRKLALQARRRKGGKVGARLNGASQAGHRYSLVAYLLLGAALGEFLILRLFMRMGALLPDAPAVRPLYGGLALVGSALLNLAFLLALAIVERRAWACFSRRHWGDSLGGLLLASFGIVALAVVLSPLWGLTSPWLLLAAGVLLPLALAYCAGGVSGDTAFRMWLWSVVGVVALATYSALVAPLGLLGLSLPGASVAIQGAEGLMLLLAVSVALWIRPRWNPLALALGVFVYSLAYAFRQDGRALGLALVALSGLRVDIPYIALLALAGVVLATWPSLQTNPLGIHEKTPRSGEQARQVSTSCPH